ncbi:MAG: hypothetical protein Q4E62_08635, partial [Sutterellaceae bacterium]|nr:hypothetical protein [Sutterellaceae bacterium]
RRHRPDLKPAVTEFAWNIDRPEGVDAREISTAMKLLPKMKTDITLQKDDRKLVIDAKFYQKIMAVNFGEEKYQSHNLYQIFAYVKNLDKAQTGKVSGLLLYAKTEENRVNEVEFPQGGNRFAIKTLDLNCEFSQIATQLDAIAEREFGPYTCEMRKVNDL